MDEGRIRKIIHIDMDAFYASVEQRDDPTLKGKPVAVGYPAKRGVVAAASYEARSFGVRSAMPSTVAIRKCAELVFVPPRFDVYREVSKQIHAIFKNYTRLVEPLSLDEAYLDVTVNLKGIPTAWETAKEIRARIYEETRLTASAGISCNKFLAKLASDHRKPNGQFAILPEQAEAFVGHYRSRSSMAWAQRRRPRCAPSALRQARTCDGKPSISYRTASASQGVGTTTSREVGTNGRSNLTGNESRWDRRRRSRRTGVIPFKSRPV